MVRYLRPGEGWELKVCEGETHSRRAHSHAEWSFGLVSGGSCALGLGGRTLPVQAPALVWFSPETVHECRPADDSLWAFRMVYWRAPGDPGLGGVQTLDAGNFVRWRRWFDGLSQGRWDDAAFPWLDQAPARGQAEDRFGEGLARPDRAYKRRFGLAPTQHATVLRLRRAQELLRTGRPPAEVALETGFYDQPQFTREFRRLTGTTPAAYARG